MCGWLHGSGEGSRVADRGWEEMAEFSATAASHQKCPVRRRQPTVTPRAYRKEVCLSVLRAAARARSPRRLRVEQRCNVFTRRAVRFRRLSCAARRHVVTDKTMSRRSHRGAPAPTTPRSSARCPLAAAYMFPPVFARCEMFSSGFARSPRRLIQAGAIERGECEMR